MIHYHGLPITPEVAAYEVVNAGHPFISFAYQQQMSFALTVCQSFAVDNGAFSAWKSGKQILSWHPYYEWVDSLKNHPFFDFAVIPDVIDGSEEANDKLLSEWPHGNVVGAPVWHMHESVDRLQRLCAAWRRVCIGSSAQFATVGNKSWWDRIEIAFDAIVDKNGYPIAKIHGLRMLNPKVFSKLPFASADSTNIARNVGMDDKWKTSSYPPPTKASRAKLMRDRVEAYNAAQSWQSEL